MKNKLLAGILALSTIFSVNSVIAMEEAGVLEGFGQQIPLSWAVRQIVPPGQDITFAGGVPIEKLVDWQGGMPWDVVLKNTLNAHGLTFREDRDGGFVIDFQDARSVGSPGIILTEYEGPDVSRQAGNAESHFVGEGNAFVSPTNRSNGGSEIMISDGVRTSGARLWKIPSGTTLEEVLTEWSEIAGWTLIWDSEYEYPIAAGASIQGDFLDAVRKIVESMKNASPAIKASAYKDNKVLVINTTDNE